MPTQPRAQRTRERLLEAAVRLIAEKGSLETTFDAVAEAAGMSRGTINFHFGNKDGLLFAVVDRVFREWESEIVEPLITAADGPPPLRAAVEAHLQFVRDNPEVGRLLFVLSFESLGPRPALRERFADLNDRFRTLADAYVRAAQEAGIVAADLDVDAVGSLVVAALGGVHWHWQLDPARVDLERAHETLAVLLERALRP